MSRVDNFLNQITMYRLTRDFLRLLVGVAAVLAFFGRLPFSPWALLASVLFLVGIGWVVNKVFAAVFAVPANVESFEISAYILALIIQPLASFHDLPFLFWAIVLKIYSKFIFAIRGKHNFNTVAVAVVVTALALSR